MDEERKDWANHKSEALDNYIASMRALVDVISVGAPGTPACTPEKLRKLIKLIGETAERKLTTLVEQLIIVAAEGIVAGNVHDNLEAYIEKLMVMQTQLEGYTDAVNEEVSEFLAELEIKDCSIYEGGEGYE